MVRRRTGRAWLGFLGFLLTACASVGPPSATPATSESIETPTTASTADDPAIVLAAGDVAACDSDGDAATAALLDELAGTIVVPGDIAYPSGRVEDFANCYDPTWGRHRDRTYPVPGNHEYESDGAAPYFDYFGPVAGDPDEGWYSLDLGEWHVIGLNSNCEAVGGCGPGSAQATWLEMDLDETDAACTLAFWHHPRWSSGDEHGSDDMTDMFWRQLHAAGVDLVLTGHDHQYERFEPMDAGGAADPDGMVEFVVGTGGRSLYGFDDILPTSAAHDNSSYGLLKLTLRADAYDWEFVPAAGTAFEDSGTGSCR